MAEIAEPARRLSPRARSVWRIYWAATCAAVAVAAATAARPIADELGFPLWPLAVIALVLGTPIVPGLRWSRWRWEVREHEIDLRRGTLRVRRTLIPMARVQHVETTRGILEQALKLATVQIHTAAGSHTIPLLNARDAAQLRARIAELARTEPFGG